MKNYVQYGRAVYVPAPTGGTVSGNGYLIGTMFGIAGATAAAGATVALHVQGMFTINKLSAQAWTVGAAVYWDNTAFQATTVSTSNTRIGVATAVAANPSATGEVRLNGAFFAGA